MQQLHHLPVLLTSQHYIFSISMSVIVSNVCGVPYKLSSYCPSSTTGEKKKPKMSHALSEFRPTLYKICKCLGAPYSFIGFCTIATINTELLCDFR